MADRSAGRDGWSADYLPWHMWQFDSATGACAFNAELRIPVYPVRVEEKEILVDLPHA